MKTGLLHVGSFLIKSDFPVVIAAQNAVHTPGCKVDSTGGVAALVYCISSSD